MGRIFADTAFGDDNNKGTVDTSRYLGTTYILNHKADFEPGRSSDFIFKVKFKRDLYDMDGLLVCGKDEATEALALSLRDYAGPQISVDPISIKTGNGTVHYAGSPNVGTSAITFNDYIGMLTEQILLAWYSMAHNITNDKIGFKEYYAQDGILYKWAPNGTRQISWKLLGCWINEYNQGQYSRYQPDQRLFSTTIYYDKPVPFATPDYSNWMVTGDNNNQNAAYTTHTNTNYIGTLSNNQRNS